MTAVATPKPPAPSSTPGAPAYRRFTARRALRRVPAFLLVTVLLTVTIYPLLYVFFGSLKTRNELLSGSPFALPQEWRWDNYATAWVDGNMGQYTLNSLVAVLPSIAILLLLGIGAGFALEVLVFKGRGAVLLAFLAGIMIPGQLILLPLFTIYFRAGLTGTLWPLIITYVAGGLPLTVFMMASYFRSVPRELFEAATIDGAGILRMFFSIAVPMVRNAVLTIGLVQFFFMWNDLLVAITFTNSNDLRTLQVGLLNFTGEQGIIDYGPLFAAICINLGGILVLYLFLNQRIMKGMAAGAVKA